VYVKQQISSTRRYVHFPSPFQSLTFLYVVISGTNLFVPSERTPAGLYVTVTTPNGRWNTAIKTVMADRRVPWNETLIIPGFPLMLPTWLMPVVPRSSKAVRVEIRASFEHECLGRGELLGIVDTTLEELLSHAREPFRELLPFSLLLSPDGGSEICLPVGNAERPSVILRARHINAAPVGNTLQVHC
jgi:hypothetical protein